MTKNRVISDADMSANVVEKVGVFLQRCKPPKMAFLYLTFLHIITE